MGWFNISTGNAVLGDDAFDEAHAFLKRLSLLYTRALGRKPSLEEFQALMEVSLAVNAGEFLDGFEERQVSGVTFKTIKKRKSQSYKVGDLFALPLAGGRMAFGRVMQVSKSRGVLMEVLSTGPGSAPSGRMERMGHPFYTSGLALKSGRWRVIASDPEYAMSDGDRSMQFVGGDEVIGWRVVDLDGNVVKEVSAREAEEFERLIVWQPEQVENRVLERLLNSG